jgi:hypothetical protein
MASLGEAGVAPDEVFARLAKSHELVFAPHFPYPGVGHVVADGDAYTWVPEVPEVPEAEALWRKVGVNGQAAFKSGVPKGRKFEPTL